jgi:hypothetical protein
MAPPPQIPPTDWPPEEEPAPHSGLGGPSPQKYVVLRRGTEHQGTFFVCCALRGQDGGQQRPGYLCLLFKGKGRDQKCGRTNTPRFVLNRVFVWFPCGCGRGERVSPSPPPPTLGLWSTGFFVFSFDRSLHPSRGIYIKKKAGLCVVSIRFPLKGRPKSGPKKTTPPALLQTRTATFPATFCCRDFFRRMDPATRTRLAL